MSKLFSKNYLEHFLPERPEQNIVTREKFTRYYENLWGSTENKKGKIQTFIQNSF